MNTAYIVKPTGKFRKDYKLMEKRNMDMSLLDEVIAMLALGKPLPPATVTMRYRAIMPDTEVAISSQTGCLYTVFKKMYSFCR